MGWKDANSIQRPLPAYSIAICIAAKKSELKPTTGISLCQSVWLPTKRNNLPVILMCGLFHAMPHFIMVLRFFF